MRFLFLFFILGTLCMQAQELPTISQLKIPALENEVDSFVGLNYKEEPFEGSFTLIEVDLFNKDESNDVNMMAVMQNEQSQNRKNKYVPRAFAFREEKKKSVITLEAKTDYQYYSNNRDVKNSVYKDASRGLYFRSFYGYPNIR